ncbi:hypothetical protein ACOI22_14975 [Glaciecola sp. 2405UD65-10]|uniref:hypothetical protein n=1 Tax=Glaciecola sp. 2405UD65-10 TaxID=3397244 RepID=UPI003B5B6CD1
MKTTLLNKIALLSVLLSAFTSSSFAAVISIDGSYYDKIESSYYSDSTGANESSFEQIALARAPGPISGSVTFNPNTANNRAVVIESDSYASANSSQSWQRAIYTDVRSALAPTNVTSGLFALFNPANYDVLNAYQELWAINEARTDVNSGITDYYSDLYFSFVSTGDFVTNNQDGSVSTGSFIYFMNIFLNLDRPQSEVDYIGLDALGVNEALLAHNGQYVTVSEGVTISTYNYDSNGFYESYQESVSYLGDAIVSVEAVDVPAPYILSLFITGLVVMFRKR